MIALLTAILLSSSIRSDERVVFFPTAAHQNAAGNWVLPIHGWIFEPESDDSTRRLFLNQMKLGLANGVDPRTQAIFESRLQLFLVDNERGKRLAVRVGGREARMGESAADGHFFGSLTLDDATARKLGRKGAVPFNAVTGTFDRRHFGGRVKLVGAEGVSVISDIDDTIKITEVTNKVELVKNTFYRFFKPVPGMAELYRDWAKRGAQFHFVSTSPWQLYRPLSQLTYTEKFPDATFHLMRVRLKDSSVQKMFADPMTTKPSVIEPMMSRWPKRRFILVGDSGQHDPEVYGSIARKHPKQVIGIYIRNITKETAANERMQAAFKSIPSDRWRLFTDPATLTWPE